MMEAEAKPVGHTCLKRLWVFSILAGVLAGISGWGAGEAAEPNFPASLNQFSHPNDLTQQRSLNLLRNLKLQMQKKKGAIAYGLLAGLAGVYLAVAGGLARRSFSDTPKAAIIALIVGAGLAVALAYWLVPWYFRWIDLALEADVNNDPARGFIIHLGIWISAAVAAGLGLGLASGEGEKVLPGIIGGLLGVALAAIIYESIGYAVFLSEDAASPVPGTSLTRLIAHMLVGVLVAVGAAWGSSGLSLSKKSKTT
jgi:hypothetical protein